MENAIPGISIINIVTLGDNFGDIRVTYVTSSYVDFFLSSREEFTNNAILSEKVWIKPAQRNEFLSMPVTKELFMAPKVGLKRQESFLDEAVQQVLKPYNPAFQYRGSCSCLIS